MIAQPKKHKRRLFYSVPLLIGIGLAGLTDAKTPQLGLTKMEKNIEDHSNGVVSRIDSQVVPFSESTIVKRSNNYEIEKHRRGEFRVEGILTKIQGGRSQIDNFSVNVSNQTWSIRIEPNDGFDRYNESFFDGEIQLGIGDRKLIDNAQNNKENAKASITAAASIRREPFPTDISHKSRPILWFAYCSSYYLDIQSSSIPRTIYDNQAPPVARDRTLVQRIQTDFKLPESATFWNSGTNYDFSMKPVISTHAPGDDYTNAYYQVLRWTNINNVRVPAHFAFESFRLDNAVAHDAVRLPRENSLVTLSRWIGLVTNVSSISQVAKPVLPSKLIHFSDYRRFSNDDPSVRITYYGTNWISEDEALKHGNLHRPIKSESRPRF